MKVFIIIPVHNRIEKTRLCLQCLGRQSFPDRSIIVVDDGSTDGTWEMIGSEFPDVHRLRGDGDLWWTGATNKGLRHAMRDCGGKDFILLFNNDTTVQADYLELLLTSASERPYCLLGSVAVSDVDGQTIVDGGVRINWRTAKYTRLRAGEQLATVRRDRTDPEPVDVLSGRGMLVPASAFKSVGLLNDKQLPHYGADYEFSARAKRGGYDLLVDYNCVVISDVHVTGLNNEAISLSWGSLLRSFFSIRSPNNLKYRWRFARLVRPPSSALLYFLADFARLGIACIRNQFRNRNI